MLGSQNTRFHYIRNPFYVQHKDYPTEQMFLRTHFGKCCSRQFLQELVSSQVCPEDAKSSWF